MARMSRLAVCRADACWEELFYPLTRAFIANTHLYTVGASAVIGVFTVALVILTDPWWWRLTLNTF